MRKHAGQDISSFDMLLDTMCNTFGGIVFIALLLSILSASINRQSSNTSHEKTGNLKEVEQSVEMTKLQREQQSLQTAVSYLRETLAKSNTLFSISTNTLSVVVASNSVLRAELALLVETNANLTAAITVSSGSNEMKTATKSDLQVKIVRLREELRQKRQASTHTVRLPRLHIVKNKNPVFFAIKDGKFYAISDVSKNPMRWQKRGFDQTSVDVKEGPSLDVIECRKTAGQLVQNGCESFGKLAQAIANLNSEIEFPSFAVYTNSFAEFNYVKAVFVQHGFIYAWVPSEGAVEIVRTDTVQAQ